MTPLQFEQQYQGEWQELEQSLRQLRTGSRKEQAAISGTHMAKLYRSACEHLALARTRAYPTHLTDRLDQITADAHQVIYQRREFALAGLKALIMVDIPRAVRAQAIYVWIAATLFVVPTLVLGVLVYLRPELILSVVDAATTADFINMYSPDTESIGRTRNADTDWTMFGYYVRHNVGIAFQCFGGGLLLGVGSLFFMAYNGVVFGAVAGYLTERGLASTFYSFVVTHAAFELTAIVLSGAAGLRLGHSILAPRHATRMQSLVTASKESVVIMYGAAGMLLIAAVIEAFWSSATWIPAVVKYSVAAICWTAVFSYLIFAGRRAG